MHNIYFLILTLGKPWALRQGRRVNNISSLKICSKSFLLLILSIVIVNVLICDLKNSKRPPGGSSPGGGGRKFQKSAYFNSFNQVSVLSICVRNRKIEQQSFLNRRKRTITLVKALNKCLKKVFKRCDLWDIYVEWRRSATTRTWSSSRLTSKISWFFK